MPHLTSLLLQLLFTTMLFAAVTMTVWGAWRAFGSRDVQRRRILQRLVEKKPTKDTAASGQPTLLVSQQRSAISSILNRYSFLREIEGSLKQAMPDMKVERFLTIAGGIGAIVGVAMFFVQFSLLAGLIGFVAGGYLPFIWLANRRLRRQRQISDQLPDGLDFLGRSMRAGHSFPVGMQMMGTELPAPLCEEFARAHDEISLGTPPDKALKSMTERIESSDFAFFVTAVLVQRQTGGDLAQVLDNITGMLRQRIQLQQHVKAKTAEGRFTGYILAGFPIVMFVITYFMSPETAGILITTFQGKMLFGLALGLSALGLYVIRKITNVTV